MRIGFATSDWGRDQAGNYIYPGGAAWVRLHSPARALEALGHETAIGHVIAARTDHHLVPLNQEQHPVMADPELVVIQRWMHRDAPDAIRAAQAAGQPVINDVDDWFWGLDRRNRAHAATDPRNSPDANRDHYAKALLASAVVTVSTRFLEKKIRERLGANTVLIRNAIDLPMFAAQPVDPITEGLTVGWTGALAVRSGDLETMRGILGPYLADIGGEFVHHGTAATDRTNAADLAGVNKANRGPSRPLAPPWDYPMNVAGFDIGIVPLNDVPFNHAKSWIKGLEYAAAGIPFVAFDTEEYRELGAGILARTPAQWRHALDALRDPETRRAVRANGLAIARKHALTRRIGEWERVYEQVVERARRAQQSGARA